MNTFKELRSSGHSFRSSGDYEQAIQRYEQALDIKPKCYNVMTELCKCLIDIDDIERFEKYLNRFIPESVDRYNMECYRVANTSDPVTSEIIEKYRIVLDNSTTGGQSDWYFYKILKDKIKPHDTTQSMEVIPRNLFVYFDKDPPEDIVQNIQDIISHDSFNVQYYNKEMTIDYLNQHHGKEVVDMFLSLGHASPESDFFRFHMMHHYGGYYLDADLKLEGDVSTYLKTFNNTTMVVKHPTDKGPIRTGFIGACAGTKLIENTIQVLYNNCINHPGLSPWLKTGPGPLTRGVINTLYSHDGDDLTDLPLLVLPQYTLQFLTMLQPSYRGDERDWRKWHTNLKHNEK